jgi:hypothetical protein
VTVAAIVGIVLAVSVVEEFLFGAIFFWGAAKWRKRRNRFAY